MQDQILFHLLNFAEHLFDFFIETKSTEAIINMIYLLQQLRQVRKSETHFKSEQYSTADHMRFDWEKKVIMHINQRKQISKYRQKTIWNDDDRGWIENSSDIIKKIMQKHGQKSVTISGLEQFILMFLKQKTQKEQSNYKMIKILKKQDEYKITDKKDEMKKEYIYTKEEKVSTNF